MAQGAFWSLLQVLLIGLKLGGIIDWSWWWVLSPMWVPATLLLVFGVSWLVVVKVFERLKDA